MKYDSLGVIKWYCKAGFAVPFNFIRFLISVLWAISDNYHYVEELKIEVIVDFGKVVERTHL